MVDAGLDKEAVRALSRGAWSRHVGQAGSGVSRLSDSVRHDGHARTAFRGEGAEFALKQMGFPEVRVRHYEEIARIEVPIDSLARVVERRAEVVAAVKQGGTAT